MPLSAGLKNGRRPVQGRFGGAAFEPGIFSGLFGVCPRGRLLWEVRTASRALRQLLCERAEERCGRRSANARQAGLRSEKSAETADRSRLLRHAAGRFADAGALSVCPRSSG